MEGDLTEEERKSETALRAGDKTRYRKYYNPCYHASSSSSSRISESGYFCSGNPIFPVAASPFMKMQHYN